MNYNIRHWQSRSKGGRPKKKYRTKRAESLKREKYARTYNAWVRIRRRTTREDNIISGILEREIVRQFGSLRGYKADFSFKENVRLHRPVSFKWLGQVLEVLKTRTLSDREIIILLEEMRNLRVWFDWYETIFEELNGKLNVKNYKANRAMQRERHLINVATKQQEVIERARRAMYGCGMGKLDVDKVCDFDELDCSAECGEKGKAGSAKSNS